MLTHQPNHNHPGVAGFWPHVLAKFSLETNKWFLVIKCFFYSNSKAIEKVLILFLQCYAVTNRASRADQNAAWMCNTSLDNLN